MDVAGAQALAERIQQQQARALVPAEDRPNMPRSAQAGDEVVWLPARSVADARDLRMYTAAVRLEQVDGRSTVVTVVRCWRVVEGQWESQVVEVEVGRPRVSI